MSNVVIQGNASGSGSITVESPNTNSDFTLVLPAASGVVPSSTSTTGALITPVGTTAQRPGSPTSGMLRFNTDEVSFEGYDGIEWGAIGGGSVEWQTTKTSNFTAEIGSAYPVNTTSGTINATLPANPSLGDTVIFLDYAGTFATNNLVIKGNGSKVASNIDDTYLQTNKEVATFVYLDSTVGWVLTNAYLGATAFVQGFFTEYLTVAGGGGGGGRGGGGGGAGGYRTAANFLVSSSTNYTVTVGAGGAGGQGVYASAAGDGSDGSASVFSSITSAGGGGGGGTDGRPGKNGGSGGGAGRWGSSAGGTGNTPVTSPSQGNNGAIATTAGSTSPDRGGGGGGAGAVGVAGATSGNGGNGSASSITGTSVTRGGGGGGGARDSQTAGTGGTGGGGNGGNVNDASGFTGTVNTGGGGGGGGLNGADSIRRPGGAGGSGIVIIKYPDIYTISNPGGGLTYTTAGPSGGFKVTTFTAGTGNVSWS